MSFDPFSYNYQNKRSDSINECLPTLGRKCTHLQFSQTRPPVAVLVNQRHQRFVNILVLLVVVRNSEVNPKLFSRGRGKIPKKKKKKGKVSAHRLGGKKMAAMDGVCVCEKSSGKPTEGAVSSWMAAFSWDSVRASSGISLSSSSRFQLCASAIEGCRWKDPVGGACLVKGQVMAEKCCCWCWWVKNFGWD